MTSERDEALVEAALAGDRAAFGELIEKYQIPMYNISLRITGSPDDAMDATQSAFLSAYENLHRFDPRYRFFSWLYRITINQAIDIVKGRRESELPQETPDTAAGPDSRYETVETRRWVQRAILRLPEDQRAVVVLRHYLGMSYREMAETVGVAEKTVKSRLYSARQKLRELLLPEPGEEAR